MNRPRLYTLTAIILLLLVWPLYGQKKTDPITGIMGAFGKETTFLLQKANDKKTREIMGITFVTGTLESRKVVVVQTGFGKVNAAYLLFAGLVSNLLR